MKEKRISFCQGKGSLTHNNREFIAENIDRNRIKDNVTFIRQDLGKAYDQLFAESTERYNAKQKRNDRKIHGTYYESLFHQKPSNTVVTAADKRKSFYEDVVQIGKMDDSGVGTEDAELEKYRQPATFSRENLSKESKRISETENLKSKLRKATAFIDAYGLSEEFKRFTYNKLRNTEIE